MPDFNYPQEGFLPMSQVGRMSEAEVSQLLCKTDGGLQTESVIKQKLTNLFDFNVKTNAIALLFLEWSTAP